MELLIFIIGVIIGAGGMWFYKEKSERRKSKVQNRKAPYSDEVNEVRDLPKFDKEWKERIIAMFDERTEIGNNDVEKALGVSDATATRYLSELEAEGMLEQVGGEAGRSVAYRLRER